MSETIPLGEVLEIRKGKKAAKLSDWKIDGTLPYIQIDEVRGRVPSKYAIDSNAVEVTEKDLCIVWDGANAGIVGYGVAGVIGSTVARMRLREPDCWETPFLGRLLEGKFRQLNDQALARGATIPHVDKIKLEAVNIPRIGRDKQRRIAAILDKADAIRRKREQALALADNFLKSAFVHLSGYKNTEYSNWEPRAIESLAEARKGSMRTGPFGSALRHTEFVDRGIAVLGIDNAVKNRFTWGERRFITQKKYSELSRYRVFPGDVIITIMGTTGRSAVVPDDIPKAITTKHLAAITCNRKLVLPEFLSYAIHSDPLIVRQIKQANKGAIMDGLNLGIIRKLKLNVPPLAIQQDFVKLLNLNQGSCERAATDIGSGQYLFASLSQRAFRGEL
ncbi:MAG: restriction endonuclease subunit S [Halieaceae bacterium]|nr:restriction endonuclease subunit S [Halieaceae bacterium]